MITSWWTEGEMKFELIVVTSISAGCTGGSEMGVVVEDRDSG